MENGLIPLGELNFLEATKRTQKFIEEVTAGDEPNMAGQLDSDGNGGKLYLRKGFVGVNFGVVPKRIRVYAKVVE